ncbi:MAG: type II toxin-antitoxin system RelE/ParE family toxin [Desulfobacterales bacterium]|nr:type II toxin-antitoxin system RelE/ParE family toxin [Desulfobacterales bacterium]
MKILFAPTVRVQFLSAISHIRRDKPSAATRFRQRAEKSLKRLLEYPDSGRFIPEFPELPYRELIVPPYRFFYRVKDDIFWIVAVWHGAQLPEEPT